MVEIINLRIARKARDRAAAAASADANRVKFGRSKGEKLASTTETARREKLLDGALRDDTERS
jgi:hypothetical protein